MGIFCIPAYSNHWAVKTRVYAIADTLSRKRYKDLRGSIHLVDNSLKDQNKHDKLLKVRPLLEMVQANCLKVERKKLCQSINKSPLLKPEGMEYDSITPKSP